MTGGTGSTSRGSSGARTMGAAGGASPTTVADGGAPAGIEDIVTANGVAVSTDNREVSLEVSLPSCEAITRQKKDLRKSKRR